MFNSSKSRKLCFNNIFITNNSFVILKRVIKSFFQPKSNCWSIFLEAGGDENLIINVLQPKVKTLAPIYHIHQVLGQDRTKQANSVDPDHYFADKL